MHFEESQPFKLTFDISFYSETEVGVGVSVVRGDPGPHGFLLLFTAYCVRTMVTLRHALEFGSVLERLPKYLDDHDILYQRVQHGGKATMRFDGSLNLIDSRTFQFFLNARGMGWLRMKLTLELASVGAVALAEEIMIRYEGEPDMKAMLVRAAKETVRRSDAKSIHFTNMNETTHAIMETINE